MLKFVMAALFVLAILLTTSVHGDNECYYNNGVDEPNDYMCGEYPSPCCPDDSLCMLNGLCLRLDTGAYEHHTCTDITWQSPSCPKMCLGDGNPVPNLAESRSIRSNVNKIPQVGFPAPKAWITLAAGTIGRWIAKTSGATTRAHVQRTRRMSRAWSLSLLERLPQTGKW